MGKSTDRTAAAKQDALQPPSSPVTQPSSPPALEPTAPKPTTAPPDLQPTTLVQPESKPSEQIEPAEDEVQTATVPQVNAVPGEPTSLPEQAPSLEESLPVNVEEFAEQMAKELATPIADPQTPKAPETQTPHATEKDETEEQDAPEVKVSRCAACDAAFPFDGSEVCPGCLAKAKTRRKARNAGYRICEVVGEGMVRATGFVDDHVKTSFIAGDIAEFSEADIRSLPDRFISAE